MGGGAARRHAQIVAAGDGIRRCAADALRGLGGDAAGTHGADLAADALVAEAAVGRLVLYPILPDVDADLDGCFLQTGGVSLHLLHSRALESFTHLSVSSFRCICAVWEKRGADPRGRRPRRGILMPWRQPDPSGTSPAGRPPWGRPRSPSRGGSLPARPSARPPCRGSEGCGS